MHIIYRQSLKRRLAGDITRPADQGSCLLSQTALVGEQLECVLVVKVYEIVVSLLHRKPGRKRRDRAYPHDTDHRIRAVIFPHAEDHLIHPQTSLPAVQKLFIGCNCLESERDQTAEQQIHTDDDKHHRLQEILHHIQHTAHICQIITR